MATAVSDEERREGEQRDAFTLTPAGPASPAYQAGSTMRSVVYHRERSPFSMSCDRRRQIADADQVVRRDRQGEQPLDHRAAAMAQLAHQRHGLQPAEDLLDPFA